jgi:hypothetical protein
VRLLFFVSKMLKNLFKSIGKCKKIFRGLYNRPPLLGEGIGTREGWEKVEERKETGREGKGVRERGGVGRKGRREDFGNRPPYWKAEYATVNMYGLLNVT